MAVKTVSQPSLTPLRLIAPLVFWLVLIFIFSAFRKTLIPQSKYISWDKLAHLVEYGILGYLAARAAFFSGIKWIRSQYFLLTIVFGLLWALSDEFHQSFVKGRFASEYDVAADFLGVVIGAIMFTVLLRKGRYQRRGQGLSSH